MANTYTDRLRFPKPADGDGNWGTPWRKQMDLIDEAIAGLVSVAVAADNVTLTALDELTDQSRPAILKLTGTPAAQRDIIIPAQSKLFEVWNATTQSVRVKAAAGTGFVVPTGKMQLLFCDGTDVYAAHNSLVSGGLEVVSASAGGVKLPQQIIARGKAYAQISDQATVSILAAGIRERVFPDNTGGLFLIAYTPGRIRINNVNLNTAGIGFLIGSSNGAAGYSTVGTTVLVEQAKFGLWFAQSNPMVQTGAMGSYNGGSAAGVGWAMPTGGFAHVASIGVGERLLIRVTGEFSTGNILWQESEDHLTVWKLTA